MAAITTMMHLRQTPRREGLKEAVRNGAVTAICRLFEEARSVSGGIDEELMDLLLALAIEHRHTRVVEFLIHHGADANGTHHGIFHLHRAVIRGYDDIIKVLVPGGAEVTYQNEATGKTALHLAAANCGLTSAEDIINLLIASTKKSGQISGQLNGHSLRKRKLSLSVDDLGKENISTVVVKAIGDQHMREATNICWGEEKLRNSTIIGRTVHPRHSESLSLSEYLEVKDKVQGNTALHVACAYNNTPAALCLLRHGAEPNTLNLHGDTPLAKLLRPVTRCQDDGHNQSRLTLARRLVALGLAVVCDERDGVKEQPVIKAKTKQYQNEEPASSCTMEEDFKENAKFDRNDQMDTETKSNDEDTPVYSKRNTEVTPASPTDNITDHSSPRSLLFVSQRTLGSCENKTDPESSKRSLYDNVKKEKKENSDTTKLSENYEKMFDRLLEPLSDNVRFENSLNYKHSLFTKHLYEEDNVHKHAKDSNTQQMLSNSHQNKGFQRERRSICMGCQPNPKCRTAETQTYNKRKFESINLPTTLQDRSESLNRADTPKRESANSFNVTVLSKPPRPRRARAQTCETEKSPQHPAMETSTVSLLRGCTTHVDETTSFSEQKAGTRVHIRSRSRHTASCFDTVHDEQQVPASVMPSRLHVKDGESIPMGLSDNAKQLTRLRDISNPQPKDLPSFRFPNKEDRLRARYRRLSRDVSTTFNLQQLCRLVILRALVGQSLSGSVWKLGLPVPMQRFLLYEGLF